MDTFQTIQTLQLILMIGMAIAVFITIKIAISRWIFRINTIVGLLREISDLLKVQT